MLKRLFPVTFLFFSGTVIADSSPYFILRNGEGCYVKSYINRKFYEVNYKKFWGVKLLAQPHKKNANYYVFRVDDQIYVTKAKCLEAVEIEDRFDDLVDSKPEEDYSRYNKIPSYRMENLQINDQRYMVELDFGRVNFASRDPIFRDYNQFDGIPDENGNTYDFSNKARSGKFKGGSLFGLTLGKRMTDVNFLALKLRRFSGKKIEKVDADNNSFLAEFEYDQSFTSVLFGSKFLLLPNSHLRPTFGVYGGLNLIDGDLSTSPKIEISSVGPAFLIDAGLEFFISRNFSIGASYGFELLGTRRFRVVDKDDELTDRGFTSRMNYNNTFFTGGVKVYF